jgi:hypothetical protein
MAYAPFNPVGPHQRMAKLIQLLIAVADFPHMLHLEHSQSAVSETRKDW